MIEGAISESVIRYCGVWKASNGRWYLDLAEQEYAEYEDATTYGPFRSEDAANKYLHDNFSNPGGYMTDESGKEDPPTKSPNGHKVVNPSAGSHGSGGSSYFSGGGMTTLGHLDLTKRWR
jgi:hypothetical protein